jgi:TolA-binding protein
MLDRRIAADDVASFERHLQSCTACARELHELRRLKELGEQLPWPKSEPLQRRRRRGELLRHAHGADANAAPARWRRLGGVAAIAAVALCLLVLGGVATERVLRPEVPSPQNVSYEVLPGSGRGWREVQGGHDVRLQLREGEITVRISKLETAQSFVLWLPDGELEVRGTTFTVELTSGRTSRVAVREGLVALRLAAQPERLLGANQVWQAEAIPQPTSSPSVALAPRASSAESARSAAPRTTVRAPALPPAAAPALSSAEPSTATDFALAMATFSRGDFASAEQLFQRFEARHPHSSQVEDSLFLRALSRERRGDAQGARALATEYLRRYPRGFRAAEAGRLVREP